MIINKLFNRNHFLLLSCLALLLLCPAQNILAQGAAASVLEISGSWYVDGGRNISKGSSLRSGAVIRARSPGSQTDYIVITNLTGDKIAWRYCRNEGSCNDPIIVPAPSPCGLLCRLYRTAMETLNSDPNKYKTTGSQDIGKGLQEAVVLLDKNKIDLKSVFKEMPDDNYRIRFVEPPCPDLENCKTLFGPIDFKWSSKSTSLLTVGNLRPGLYEVQLLKKDEDTPTGVGEAWILITDSRKFRALSSKFKDALNITKKWSTDSGSTDENPKIRNTTIRSFLRATLSSLSAPTKTLSTKKRRSQTNKTLNSRKKKRNKTK